MYKQENGFSLIELMIVVTIVGLLSMVAYPSYQDYVRRAERAVAMGFVAEIAQRQEVVFNNRRAYLDWTNLGMSMPSKLTSSYSDPVIPVVDPATGVLAKYAIVLQPKTSGIMKNDGGLVYCWNGVRFRDVNGNVTTSTPEAACTQDSSDKTWDDK